MIDRLWTYLAYRWRSPAPPVNVRLMLDDGTVVPLECTYQGWVRGAHLWHAVCPVALPDGASGATLAIAAAPPRTSVGLVLLVPRP